jgi:hypothetical protein
VALGVLIIASDRRHAATCIAGVERVSAIPGVAR